ncbi:MAG: hypothetical protein IT440_14115 [Phycisphaeraceae bacterium]|nr:hypothetical protein [Phycisphaeraceae bacterium]
MILLPDGFSSALSKEALVRKIHVIRLTDEEREHLTELVRKFKGTSQKVRRLDLRHTPRHGSWLNIAENELSALTRQCVQGRRFGDIETLRQETSAWSCDVNSRQKGVDWQMKIDDARTKLVSVYPKIKM